MRPLEPGQLKVMRIQALGWLLPLVPALIVEALVLPRVPYYPSGLLVAVLAALLVYPVLVAPGRRFRAWAYEREGDELRVARGIWTKVQTIVPLARVQHVDIAQGVLERRHGVCRLILHTAGTQNNVVVLPGLARETAEGLRDEVRARIRDDAL